jgi:hypothetical protein
VPTTDLRPAWRGAQLAEVAWLGADGRPHVEVVVPLLRDGQPALALTYDRHELAEALAHARRADLAVTTPSLAGGAAPTSAPARLRLLPDPTGERFSDDLLLQELAKHPPTRRRADSLLLRREHWWYLPRLLLTADELGAAAQHPEGDGLAAVAAAGELHVTTVQLAGGEVTTRLPDGEATVLQHGARTPDLEHRWQVVRRGTVRQGRFVVRTVERTGDPDRPDGVWRRWRTERALERACRRELARATT